MHTAIISEKDRGKYLIIRGKSYPDVIIRANEMVDPDKFEWGYIWNGDPEDGRKPQYRVLVIPEFEQIGMTSRFKLIEKHIRAKKFRGSNPDEVTFLTSSLAEMKREIEGEKRGVEKHEVDENDKGNKVCSYNDHTSPPGQCP